MNFVSLLETFANSVTLSPEFIMFGTSQQLRKMQYSSITVDGEVIEGKGIVRNLGAFFDNEMKMHGHVQHILKCGNYQLRQLGVLRKCLTTKTATTLVVSLFFFPKWITATLFSSVFQMFSWTNFKNFKTPVLDS